MSLGSPIWPTEIKLAAGKRVLSIRFDNGDSFELPAELLRVMSPSAEVQGHSPDQRVLVAGKRDVAIRDIRPVGNYAVQIVFDDGHDTGYYRWAYLHDLGRNEPSLWQTYLDELAAKGLRRG
jgi:DUF971 family protein